MLNEAKDEIKLSDTLWAENQTLRNQMDEDFGYFSHYDFEEDGEKGISAKEGNWRFMTSPMGKTLGNKIKTFNQMSHRNLFIDVVEEERQKNKRISDTERLVIGMINEADRHNTRVPSGVTLQDAFAFYSAIHAGNVVSVLLTSDDEKVYPNITYYDPYGCQILEGDGELVWFCYREQKKKAFLERKYKKIIDQGFVLSDKADSSMVTCHYIWDSEEWKMAINGKWVPDEGDKHGLGYVPVFLKPVGGVPTVQSSEEDIEKHRWQSVYMNIRELIPLESEMLSIELTNAKQSAQVRGIVNFDGNLTEGQPPEEAQKIVKMAEATGSKDNVILLDTSKGVSWQGYIQQPDNQIVTRLRAELAGYNSLASIDPVAFGVLNRNASGALANILRDAALEFNHPFAKNIQDTFTWIGEEVARQYKNNEFPEVEVYGRDVSGDPYHKKIKPKDVEEHYFTCTLSADRLRDEAMEIGLALQEVNGGLLSKKEAITKHNISTDATRTLEMIQQENFKQMADSDPVHFHTGMAEWHRDQMGSDDKVIEDVHTKMAEYHDYMANGGVQIAVTSLMQQLQGLFGMNPPGTPEGGGAPASPNATTEAGRLGAEPMTSEANSMRAEMEQ